MELTKIQKTIKKSSNSNKALFLKNYMKSSLSFYGISNPNIKAAAKQIYKNSPEISYSLIKKMWSSGNFETMYASLYLLDFYCHKKQDDKLWKLVNQLASGIENWAHSDQLCNSRSLFWQRKDFLPTMKKWTKSRNLWLRRQAAVSLLAPKPKRIPFSFKQAISILEPILYDKEYYVQKGVGWMFRELHNRYPTQTRAYMKRHRNAPRIVLRTACEKMNSRQKASVI